MGVKVAGGCIALGELDTCSIPVPQMGAMLEDQRLNPGSPKGCCRFVAVVQCLYHLNTFSYVRQQLGLSFAI